VAFLFLPFTEQTMNEQTKTIAEQLAAPFGAEDIKWKPQAVSGNRALAIPYLNARAVMDRLDEVLGIDGWQDRYDLLPDGAAICTLRVRIGKRVITKMDVGGPSEQPDEGDRRKAAVSDALKRAAVKLGIGRYLYRLAAQWVDYDAQKRQFTRPPTLPPAALPTRSDKATPSNCTPIAPTAPLDFAGRLKAFDEKMALAGLCTRGECLKHVEAACTRAGYGPLAGANDWDERRKAFAEVTARDFEKKRKAPVSA
jgi:hypothetical protein